MTWECVAVLHAHSRHSDGRGTVPEILEAARVARIDCLVLTDHMTMRARDEGWEGYHDGCLLLVGYEINDPRNENHLLALGLGQVLDPHLSAVDYTREVVERGGVAILAHPDEVRSYHPKYPPYPWTATGAAGYHGLEIWNYMSEWMENLRPATLVRSLLLPGRCIRGPTDRVLAQCDRLARERQVVGIGSADAHAHQYQWHGLRRTVFRYRHLFRRIRTHLLLDAPLGRGIAADREEVLGALRIGRAFVTNRRWGDARGFRFVAASPGASWGVGDRAPFQPATRLQVTVPHRATVELWGDGRLAGLAEGRGVEWTAPGPGAYRVVARRRGHVWILSNHIVLYPPEGR